MLYPVYCCLSFSQFSFFVLCDLLVLHYPLCLRFDCIYFSIYRCKLCCDKQMSSGVKSLVECFCFVKCSESWIHTIYCFIKSISIKKNNNTFTLFIWLAKIINLYLNVWGWLLFALGFFLLLFKYKLCYCYSLLHFF